MVLRSMAEHRITARTVRPATIIVSRMVLLWQAQHPLVELHVHGFRNSSGNLAIFAAIRRASAQWHNAALRYAQVKSDGMYGRAIPPSARTGVVGGKMI